MHKEAKAVRKQQLTYCEQNCPCVLQFLLAFHKVSFTYSKSSIPMHTTFSYLIQNFCLPCIHMSKYTNNRSSQLLCIYIFTVFKSPFLGTTTTKKNTHKIKYFKPSLPFSFKLVCLCKRMPQSAYKLFADLTTCNCILQCELYKL